MDLQERTAYWKERFLTWLAWKLPRELVKWAAIRVMTYNYNGNPGERTAGESLDAWRSEGAEA